jgi:hypothetical protein
MHALALARSLVAGVLTAFLRLVPFPAVYRSTGRRVRIEQVQAPRRTFDGTVEWSVRARGDRWFVAVSDVRVGP